MSRPVLLSCEDINKAFGAQVLFRNLSFGLCEGDRVGLIGPNGSGKSTFLKILAGIEEPDSGVRAVRRQIRLGYVSQEPEFPPDYTVEQVVQEALASVPDDEIDKAGKLAVTLGKAGFTDFQQRVSALSGGWTKRLAIARELVREPAVLLLDEPTNHLDLEGVLWLESLLQAERLAFLVISHDRYFLENFATRIIELNRMYPEGLFESDGRYSDFLSKRDEALRNQTAYQESLANTVRREIDWLRHGPKARTTKAQARIKEAERLIGELADIKTRTVQSTTAIDFTSSERKSKKLLETRHLTKSFGSQPVLRDVNLILRPGMRIGLLGPNGSGKTTLLHLLAGTLPPDSGEMERADNLQIAYFEQNRASLDPELPLKRAFAPEGDSVIFRGRSIHLASWAKRFLFRQDQLGTAVGQLSGGEQARILIARLMLQPADVLILDEPTNDLDISTLEILEESLMDFPGAIMLVTHDRFLLDRVSTSLLALDGKGNAVPFADYAQWEAAQKSAAAIPRPSLAKAPAREVRQTPKLTSREKRELESMEQNILLAEEAVVACQQALEDPAVASDPTALQERHTALVAAQTGVEQLYTRWAELEEKQK